MSTKKTPRADKKFPAIARNPKFEGYRTILKWGRLTLAGFAFATLLITGRYWANAIEIDRQPHYGASEASDDSARRPAASEEESDLGGRPVSRAEPGMPLEQELQPPPLNAGVQALPAVEFVPAQAEATPPRAWLVPQSDPPRPVVGGPAFGSPPAAAGLRQEPWQMASAEGPELPEAILPKEDTPAASPAPAMKEAPPAAITPPVAAKPETQLPRGEAEAPPVLAPTDTAQPKPGKAIPYPETATGQMSLLAEKLVESRVSDLTVSIVPQKKGESPTDISIEALTKMQTTSYGSVTIRDWTDQCYWWDAPSLCHRPLYFEEVNLERYGYRCLPVPLVQPFVSGTFFFASIPALPYRMVAEPPRECVYVLGHYRPGSCVPNRTHYPPLDAKAAAAEVGVVGGLILLVP